MPSYRQKSFLARNPILAAGCGLTLLAGCLVCGGVGVVLNLPRPSGAVGHASGRVPVAEPKVSASLSDMKYNREFGSFDFTVNVENLEPREVTVYSVVYGENKELPRPTFGAWPFAFYPIDVKNNGLTPAEVTANWGKVPKGASKEYEKGWTEGAASKLKPNGRNKIEGALPVQANAANANPVYRKVHLWLFTEGGRLLSEREYEIKPK